RGPGVVGADHGQRPAGPLKLELHESTDVGAVDRTRVLEADAAAEPARSHRRSQLDLAPSDQRGDVMSAHREPMAVARPPRGADLVADLDTADRGHDDAV